MKRKKKKIRNKIDGDVLQNRNFQPEQKSKKEGFYTQRKINNAKEKRFREDKILE